MPFDAWQHSQALLVVFINILLKLLQGMKHASPILNKARYKLDDT